MNGFLRHAFVCALMGLLAACATTAPRRSPPQVLVDPQAIVAAEQAEGERSRWLSNHSKWAFEGRVAISNAGKGGSGRIDWKQEGGAYVVSLSAPVTRQSWRLTGDTHSEAGTLEGLDGGPRQGEDAEALLQAATGWEIPVNALADWVLGRSAAGYPVEARTYSAEGRPQTLEQVGWKIDYVEWHPPEAGQPALPKRIEAARDSAKVRLLIDHWDFATP
ncbi:MAG: lipoprotein insertase outer membrane protein LolB [Pseudoxanthomonas sp.]